MTPEVWSGSSDELAAMGHVPAVRLLLEAAFAGDFAPEDWEHALGGRHWIALIQGEPVAHASVVPRVFTVGRLGRVPVGYLEAVATRPDHQRRGLATRLLTPANEHIRAAYELGALSTGVPDVYVRLGWLRWRGATWVEGTAAPVRTPDDDDGVLVLPTPRLPEPDLGADLVCDWRPGDLW